MLHCGRDIAFPPDDDRATPLRVRRAVDAVPDLELIATHLGGWRMWDEALRELGKSRCLIETSFSLHEMPSFEAVEMIREFGAGRVMFGTDSPWASQEQEIGWVWALGLGQDELESIFWSNAAKLLGIP